MKQKENEIKESKKGLPIVLKIILVIIAIYLLISIYKFIALNKFYQIANSFSENNYWMCQEFEGPDGQGITRDVTKVGNQKLEEIYQNGNQDTIPSSIQFIDSNEKIAYSLDYDENNKIYRYSDIEENVTNEEELNDILNTDNNIIKETTLSIIPSNFKEILLYSINPLCHVSIRNNEIYVNNLNRTKYRIELSNDGLVTSYKLQTDFGEKLNINFSYDYVQDHFTEIDNPLEEYNNIVIK